MSAPRWMVVKLGGEVVGAERIERVAADIAALIARGMRVVVVHGGGPQATELSKRLGHAPKMVAGRRVTDRATLDVVKMAVGGQLNIDLTAALMRAGAKPIGLHDAIRATRRPPTIISGGPPEPVDLGEVGDVVGFDEKLLNLLVAAGYLPVLACLGMGDRGEVYNINADVVANRLAIALQASHLVVITSVDGVRRDLADPNTRIATLSIAEGRCVIDSGAISGGMIPKLEESFAAIESGVQQILIVADRLAQAVEHPGTIGTLIVR